MFDVRIHGRNGAEVAGTAALLAAAAAAMGRATRVLAEPRFGAGTGWAGVAVVHCLVHDGLPHSGLVPSGPPPSGPSDDGPPDGLAAGRPSQPQVDGLIIQDPGLLRRPDVLGGICPETYVLVNSAQGFGELGLSEDVRGQCRDRLIVLPAAGLRVVQQDGSLLCAMMAGGFAALAGIVDLASVVSAIEGRHQGPVADGCASAARAAYAFVRTEKEAMVAV
jgi:pyruvate ferredoxin oxidoreductase gamma subunit